mgnify:CR=1 FL=1
MIASTAKFISGTGSIRPNNHVYFIYFIAFSISCNDHHLAKATDSYPMNSTAQLVDYLKRALHNTMGSSDATWLTMIRENVSYTNRVTQCCENDPLPTLYAVTISATHFSIRGTL